MRVSILSATDGGILGPRHIRVLPLIALIFVLSTGCVTPSSSRYRGVGRIPYRTSDDQDVVLEYEYEFTHNPPDIDATSSLGRQFTDLLAETASIQISNAISAFFVKAYREYTLGQIVDATRARRTSSTVLNGLADELETEVIFAGLDIKRVRIEIRDD